MSNPLQSLISNYLKKHDISRSEFAKQLGYSNTSKGLKRLDEFLITLQSPNSEIAALILKNTDIPESEFDLAYSAVREKINDKLRKEFSPGLQVIPIYYPSLLLSLMHLELTLPENISDLSYDDEIKAICDLYLEFRAKVKFDTPKNWASGAKGFRYYREFDETLVFDKNCKLVEPCIPTQ